MIQKYWADGVEIKVTWSIQYFGDMNRKEHVPFVTTSERRNKLRETERITTMTNNRGQG
jgi:hypothetical protein